MSDRRKIILSRMEGDIKEFNLISKHINNYDDIYNNSYKEKLPKIFQEWDFDIVSFLSKLHSYINNNIKYYINTSDTFEIDSIYNELYDASNLISELKRRVNDLELTFSVDTSYDLLFKDLSKLGRDFKIIDIDPIFNITGVDRVKLDSERIPFVIKNRTRHRIIDCLLEKNYVWHGKLNDIEFLEKLNHIIDIKKYLIEVSGKTSSLYEILSSKRIIDKKISHNWIYKNEITDIFTYNEHFFIEFLMLSLDSNIVKDASVTSSIVNSLNKIIIDEDEDCYISIIGEKQGKFVYDLVHRNKNKAKDIKIYIQSDFSTYIDYDKLSTVRKPCLILSPDKWDDYTYNTSFTLDFHDGKKVVRIGDVKILDTENNVNSYIYEILSKDYDERYIKNGIKEFNLQRYVSLGQSEQYYINLLKCFQKETSPVLKKLCDINTFNDKLVETKTKLDGFQSSLLRDFNEKNKYLNNIKALLKGVSSSNFIKSKRFEFDKITLSKQNKKYSLKLKLNYDTENIFCGRIQAIIGKNGVGKSQLLKGIMSKGEDYGVSNILFINYDLASNKDENTTNTVNQIINHPKNREDLEQSVFEYLIEIYKEGRYYIWNSVINDIGEMEFSLLYETIQAIDFDSFKKVFSVLSSGQKKVLFILSSIISSIKHNGLILIDEPESNLHPSYIFYLMYKLNNLLIDFESFAVIATHSPLVLQSLSSQNVQIMLNDDATGLRLDQIDFECAGATYDEINNYIYGVEDNQLHFKRIINKAINNGLTVEEILKPTIKNKSEYLRIYTQSMYDQKHQD